MTGRRGPRGARIGLRLGLGLALVAVAGCGDDAPTGPSPGSFEVMLQGNGGNVGAVLLLVEGGAVDSVEAVGYFTASAPYSGGATEVLVAGPGLAGVLIRVRVPDVRVRYHAEVREIAQSTTHQLLPPSDYSLVLARVSR